MSEEGSETKKMESIKNLDLTCSDVNLGAASLVSSNEKTPSDISKSGKAIAKKIVDITRVLKCNTSFTSVLTHYQIEILANKIALQNDSFCISPEQLFEVDKFVDVEIVPENNLHIKDAGELYKVGDQLETEDKNWQIVVTKVDSDGAIMDFKETKTHNGYKDLDFSIPLTRKLSSTNASNKEFSGKGAKVNGPFFLLVEKSKVETWYSRWLWPSKGLKEEITGKYPSQDAQELCDTLNIDAQELCDTLHIQYWVVLSVEDFKTALGSVIDKEFHGPLQTSMCSEYDYATRTSRYRWAESRCCRLFLLFTVLTISLAFYHITLTTELAHLDSFPSSDFEDYLDINEHTPISNSTEPYFNIESVGVSCSVTFQQLDGNNIPGCKGDGILEPWDDYCYDPTLNPSLNPYPLVEIAGENNNSARNLTACIGECDNDLQCEEGLKCFQRHKDTNDFTVTPGIYEFNKGIIRNQIKNSKNETIHSFQVEPSFDSFQTPVCRLVIMLDPLIPTSIHVHAGDNGAIEVMGSRAKLPLLNITATSAAAFATLTTLQTKPDISVTVVDNSHLNTLNVNAFWTTVQVVETQFENLNVVSQQGWTDIDVAGAKTLWPMILNTTIKTEICLKSTNIIEPIEDQNVASNVQEFQFYPKGFYEDVDSRLVYMGYCSVYQYMTDGKVQSGKPPREYRVTGTGSCPSSYVESCHDTKGCFCSKTKDSCISWKFNKLYKTAKGKICAMAGELCECSGAAVFKETNIFKKGGKSCAGRNELSDVYTNHTGYCSEYTYITNGTVQSGKYRVTGTGSCPSSYVESCHDTKGCFCSKTKDSCISWKFNKLYKTANANALGYVTADSFESPANCIALCSSDETCVSFEVRSSDNRCAFSTT
jgi:hypothetical protein